MTIYEFIKEWRPVRSFTKEKVSQEQIDQILDAARWAYSGLNNQPWSFMVIKDQELKEKLAEYTKYSHIIKEADLLIAVFLNSDTMYHRTKDLLGIGGCIQNMLLTIHDMGLGGSWMGEILNQREKVEQLLGVPSNCELVLMLAIGYPQPEELAKPRKELKELKELVLRTYE